MKKLLAGLLLALPCLGQDAPPSKPPDCTAAEHHQFDFWVGSWTVLGPKGGKEGENRIESIERGCALRETWTGAEGGTGTSLNFYDRAAKRWHQTWISGNGGALFLDGALANGSMVLSGERPRRDGGRVNHRITWTPQPDGRVRQHWEQSTDGGKVWTTAFDGWYSKK